MLGEGELAKQFERLCKLAALICNKPRAILVLLEEDQIRLKASFGMNAEEKNIEPDDVYGFFDANLPAGHQFKQLFFVTIPLFDEQGRKQGALSVAGDKAFSLNKEQTEAIETLAEEILVHLSLQSQHVKLTQQRRQYEELLTVSAIAPEIHGVLDFAGTVHYVNAAVESVLGYSIEEVKKLNIWKLCHEEDLPKVTNKVAAGLKAGDRKFHIELRMISKSGSTRWISWSMVVRNGRWYVYGRDITDSKRVGNELLNLSFVLSKVNNAIVINDANNHVTWVNAAFEKITGFTLDDLKGRRLGDLLAGPNTDYALIENARALNKQNQSFTLDTLAYRKDKRPIWLSIYNTLVFDDENQVSAEVEVIIDITDKKLAEQEMIEAKEQALQLSEAKEMFLSVMSHEIRTPLNAILGMTHLLMDNEPKPSQLDDLHILKFSGENLLHIVNDILDFTKIESGKLQLEFIPFSLRTLVNDIMTSLQVNAKKQQNTLILNFDDRIAERLMGDRMRLYQVLMNLLGNASKFTENGHIELSVQLNEETEDNALVAFQVKDDGIGIPKDKQEYVFQSFTQARSDISRKYGGTGLGLAITRKLLRLYGSDIKLESGEGKGACFAFEIAFEKVSADLPAAISDHVIPDTFRNKKILVVDDNEINVAIAKRILNKWGLLTEAAYSGPEAIDKVDHTLFDLVFMDIKMPDMDGFETTELIRSKEGDYFKTLPIVALTASAMTDENRFRESGMNDYLMKPLNPQDFKAVLLKYLEA